MIRHNETKAIAASCSIISLSIGYDYQYQYLRHPILSLLRMMEHVEDLVFSLVIMALLVLIIAEKRVNEMYNRE